jgi:catechol 2,3-dioxygenase-like lactoylglutathione lyase family enzyme
MTGFTSAGVDVGIVVRDGEAAMRFYRDVLGCKHEGDNPFPYGGTMHRLLAGESMIKIVVPDPAPPADAAGGGIQGATGVRYITFSVADLDGLLRDCERSGAPIVRPATEMAPGVRIAIVRDPEGNLVEFLERRDAAPSTPRP